jgi:tetratricopeptide (TPR) repeat protein
MGFFKKIAKSIRLSEDDVAKQSHNEFMDSLKDIDPEMHKKLAAQDKQLAEIRQAEEKYKADGNIDAYTEFWEEIWSNKGLVINGRYFDLAELYIEQSMLDKAWSHLDMLFNLPQSKYLYLYKDKVSSYQVKILKQEKRYVPAIEFVMRKYGYNALHTTINPKIDPGRFIKEIKSYVAHIKKGIDKDEVAEKLLDILNSSVSKNKFDVIKMHKDLKAFLEQCREES